MSISFMEGSLRIRFAGKTDVGQVRDHNEDNVLIPTELPIAVVSDGMGGHAGGEVASQICVETVDEYYRRTAEDSPQTWPFRMPALQIERDRMSTAIKLANARIYDAGRDDTAKKGMGCTVDGIFFSQGRYYIGHVGDSRVYRLRMGQLQQLTEDHSLFNDYRRMKEGDGEDVANFPHKNVVVRALGLNENVFVDVIVDEYKNGDVYLLCSDGLSGMLDDERIAHILGEYESLDNACATLVREANEAGGNDNISVVIARVENA